MDQSTMEEVLHLDLEEKNELLFRVKVEGASGPAIVRLVCESPEGISYMFEGYGTDEEGIVKFEMPIMKDKMNEGMHQSRIEVLIENRYFSPVKFGINFKKAIKVVAESVRILQKKITPELKVSAEPVVVQKQSQAVKVAPKAPEVVIAKKPISKVPKTLRERYEQNQNVKE